MLRDLHLFPLPFALFVLMLCFLLIETTCLLVVAALVLACLLVIIASLAAIFLASTSLAVPLALPF